VAARAAARYPELYAAAMESRATFDYILQARRIRSRNPTDFGEWEIGHFLEARLRVAFEARFGKITDAYWCTRAYGGCLVTDRGHLRSSLKSFHSDIMQTEFLLKQLSRDAQRVLRRVRDRDDLAEVAETLFSALSRTLGTADLLEDDSDQGAQRSALKALREEWVLARDRTYVLIQRQARFEYFTGVLLGAPLALLFFGLIGAIAAREWPSAISAASFLAATISGTLGAVVSVSQRMASGRLKVDYTAPRVQKLLLGAWRPFLGGTLAAFVQFAIIGGLLTTVQGREPSPESPATFAFYCLVGFAGGFSERLATDLIERAGQLMTPSADDPATRAHDRPRSAEGTTKQLGDDDA
jgi:hypothetical protein